jgi:predicted alpha/beta-fold hydrolase
VSKDRTIDIKYTRHLLKMADGGTVSIDWATPAENNFTRVEEKLCVVFPGLSGGSDRGYVKNLVKTLLDNGYEVAVLHNRGVGDTEYTSPEFADLSRNEEFVKSLEYIKKNSTKKLVGVGLSMGGNMLMKIAAEMHEFPLKAIVSINNPFDIWLSINLMRGKIYEKHLALELRRNLVIRNPLI